MNGSRSRSGLLQRGARTAAVCCYQPLAAMDVKAGIQCAQVSILYSTLEEFCTSSSCPAMTAGSKVSSTASHVALVTQPGQSCSFGQA